MNNLTKKLAFCISLIAFMQINISAQNEIDALRFSELDWQGTARFMGAGRAFGAVGADFSALNTNPASIGLYKKSEITFTPMTISVFKNTSGYNGTSNVSQNVKYNVGSAGFVFAIPGISSTLWKKFQIGFGFNRIQNYNRVYTIGGRNAGSTIGTVFAEIASELGIDPNVEDWPVGIYGDEAWVAWRSYLINPVTNTTFEAIMKDVDMKQTATVTRTGGNDEMIFSFGTNYDDMLFLGATIGIPFIKFTENRVYTETNDKDVDRWFQNIKVVDRLSVRTAGINLKLGINYQPFDFLRVGAAFHTPTYYGNVRARFEREMSAKFWEEWTEDEEEFGGYFRAETEPYDDRPNYSLTTPLRAMANIAFLIKQRAFVSLEYEFADYSMARMNSIWYDFYEENNNILNTYGFSHIARIGAELSVTQVFSIRAGYNYITSPYKDDANNGVKHYASAGLGFRTRVLYGDFAYAFITSKDKYDMLDIKFANPINNKLIMHRIMLTMGVRF